MISPIKWIEPILPSSKEENKLVLLKYQDPFTKYAIFESAYLEAFWFRLRILALFNGLLNGFSIPVPIQAIPYPRITSL